MLRIDSHQHFWQVNRGDYSWLTPELGVLYQDFLPQHISPILAAQSVSQTVLVQAADSLAETEFILSLAAEHDFIVGVVGWVDMTSAQAVSDIQRLAANPYFKGIRPMLQDIKDRDWILQAKFDVCFKTLIELGLTFDALVLPEHLSNLLILAERYPQLPIVIDHGAKPKIALGIEHADNQLWCRQMRQLAGKQNVFCKLSGLLTEAGDSVSFDTIQPFMQHLLACFGPQKLMWGSDWPVINLVSQYQQWQAMSTEFLTVLSEQDQQATWATTAQSFYKL
jgi:L-fuconolactonase